MLCFQRYVDRSVRMAENVWPSICASARASSGALPASGVSTPLRLVVDNVLQLINSELTANLLQRIKHRIVSEIILLHANCSIIS